MTDPAPEQLLGYLLGALEDAECESVEQRLRRSTKLRGELELARESLEPLEASRGRFCPPVDLAARTCRRVALLSERSRSKPARLPTQRAPATVSPTPSPPAPVSDVQGPSGWVSGLRWQDVVVGAGVLAAATLLLIPAIAGSRLDAQLAASKDLLRQVGLGLAHHGEYHNGYLPLPAEDNSLATRGSPAATRRQSGDLRGQRRLICSSPSQDGDHGCYIPVLAVVPAAANREQLNRLRCWMLEGGCFGPSCVHEGADEGVTCPPRPDLVLPGVSEDVGQSGRRGDNVCAYGGHFLFEDYRVEFLVFPGLHPAAGDVLPSQRGLTAAAVRGHGFAVGHGDSPASTPVKLDR